MFIFLWIFLSIIIYFFNPQTPGVLPLFFILLFLSVFFTFSFILKNKRRALLIASIVTLFLIFRIIQIGNILNLILLTSIALSIEVYFWYTKPDERHTEKRDKENSKPSIGRLQKRKRSIRVSERLFNSKTISNSCQTSNSYILPI